VLTITDNHGHCIAPLVVRAVNVHDSVLFPESLHALMESADLLNLSLVGSYVTLDSGFDSETNRELIRSYEMIPAIKPNHRGTKDTEKREERDEAFRDVEHIYKERHRVERSYAWEDTYRKLVIRYEKLQCTFLGFRYLAYSMMNFRDVFKRT
jgi:transposase